MYDFCVFYSLSAGKVTNSPAPVRVPPSTSPANSGSGQRARVLCDYDAKDNTELSLMTDEVTTFLQSWVYILSSYPASLFYSSSLFQSISKGYLLLLKVCSTANLSKTLCTNFLVPSIYTTELLVWLAEAGLFPGVAFWTWRQSIGAKASCRT